MKPIQTFNVVPSLPAPLEGLRRLAYNLRWSWNHDTIELFRRLDRELWEEVGHNPVLLLGRIEQARLEAAAADAGFLAHQERTLADLEHYLSAELTWFAQADRSWKSPMVAYFSAEFGLSESLSIFAGGLGMLAGDHLKSASDLGVPLVGVGLLYQQGYFRQYLNEAGWQQERYQDNDFHTLPLTLQRGPDGSPLRVEVNYPGRRVLVQVWQAQVGRVPLYLLDTNLEANTPEDRDITDQLYGGDLEMRLKQEILLGIGGYRVLEALGLNPSVYHMNEGHAAFLALERLRRLVQREGLSFAEAREAASAGLVFTTHTPLPAGHDHFPPELIERYLGEYARELGLGLNGFLALGRKNPGDGRETFGMTTLALKLAAHANGVSRLHGQISRRMWQELWPGVPEAEVPIGHVTNGVHFQSWISLEMNQLFERYLGPRWREEPADPALWQEVWRIPGEELWRTHQRRRERLVSFARRRLREQLARRGATEAELEAALGVLDPEALTIGFARRFATYKRATLIISDPERLLRILSNPARPVQLVFAGKAHPRDEEGKRFIQQVAEFARQTAFAKRLVFLEDYDMAVARALVQGADVWLNNPRRPLEASGTSGMKAMANGALNLSTLDGWWDEAWQDADPAEPIGWAIGRGEDYPDPALQDRLEAEALYALLEQDVVPAFYERANGLPRRWLEHMKASIATLAPHYNTHRMVREYTQRCYLVEAGRGQALAENGYSRARALATWKDRVLAAWPQVRLEAVETSAEGDLRVGQAVEVRAWANLGALTPEEVRLEVYVGRLDSDGELVEARTTPMQVVKAEGPGRYLFQAGAVPCRMSGLHGFSVRVLPVHPDLSTPFLPGLIVWAGPGTLTRQPGEVGV
ncbi:MAG: alpha-glucan family phosphorylase [Thermaceae bacterium]|nr:alpha-glucan family phosphorylase [Thermaceae bacterium]